VKLFPGGPFLTSKRKLADILILLVLLLIGFITGLESALLALFSFGYIWNWVASQELDNLMTHKRYRFSMVKVVKSLNDSLERVLIQLPFLVRLIARCIPAGTFWLLVIFFNDSDMPWWATYLGSLSFELIQLERLSIKKEKEELQ
jgi:hypothetical protein